MKIIIEIILILYITAYVVHFISITQLKITEDDCNNFGHFIVKNRKYECKLIGDKVK